MINLACIAIGFALGVIFMAMFTVGQERPHA